MWLRELERGKKPRLSTFFLWESFLRPFNVDTTSSLAAVDVIWGVSLGWLLWVNSQGRLETSQCWIATLHAGTEAKTPAGRVVSVTFGELYPVTGTLGLWCFAGRLLPVLNTQHRNTFVSLAHLHEGMFPLGQKFSSEAFKRVVRHMHLVLAMVFCHFCLATVRAFWRQFHLDHPSGEQHSWNTSKAAAVPLVEVGTRLLLDVF